MIIFETWDKKKTLDTQRRKHVVFTVGNFCHMYSVFIHWLRSKLAILQNSSQQGHQRIRGIWSSFCKLQPTIGINPDFTAIIWHFAGQILEHPEVWLPAESVSQLQNVVKILLSYLPSQIYYWATMCHVSCVKTIPLSRAKGSKAAYI